MNSSPRHTLLTRREREIAHTREDIVLAAARAFGRRGLEATTIREIAREAGYTAQSLYAYFKGKQDIVDNMIAMMADDFEQCFAVPSEPGLSFAARFEALFERWMNFGQRWRGAFVAVTLRPGSGVEGETEKRWLGGDFFAKHVGSWLCESASPGDIGTYQPKALVNILQGIMGQLFLDWLRNGEGELPTDQMRTAVNVFLYGVTRNAPLNGSSKSAGRTIARADPPRPRRQPR